MEFGVSVVEFDGTANRVGGRGEIAGEFEGVGQSVIRGSRLRGEPDGGLGFPNGGGGIASEDEGSGEIDVRVEERRIQVNGLAQLSDGRLNFTLVEQHPAEQVVCVGILGIGMNRGFERIARGGEIVAAEGIESLDVGIVGLGSGLRRVGWRLRKRPCSRRGSECGESNNQSSASEKGSRKTDPRERHSEILALRRVY